MIAQAFEEYLVKQEGAFLTPAENLAVLVDSHNVDHAILLLSQMTYSRIPVVTDEKKFVGTISLTDIMAYRMQHDLPEEEFMAMDIVHMTKTNGLTVGVDYTISEVLHKVVGEDQHFHGIITRKSILKAVNALLHDFSSRYEMKAK